MMDLKPIFHTPVMHFDDINGRPLVGGRLYSYKAGTNTPVNLYRDPQGTLLHENPIRLNMRGECVAYGKEGLLYKLVLKDKFGAIIWEVDNVSASGVGSGGGGGGGGVIAAPLVGVEIKSTGATKRFGDDGFVKNNPGDGKPSLYLPEPGWWLFNVRLGLRNVTPRDLVQNITLEWWWNDFIEEGVPPATYTAQYPPSMQTDVDFTTTFTRQYGASALIHKDLYPDNWLTVRPIVDGGAPLTDTEWAVVIDIFKVRDA